MKAELSPVVVSISSSSSSSQWRMLPVLVGTPVIFRKPTSAFYYKQLFKIKIGASKKIDTVSIFMKLTHINTIIYT
jgi:hypothetical protein